MQKEVAANTAQLRVGRLLEIRADAGYRTSAEVDAMFEAMAREQVPGRLVVVLVDWRRCPLMSPIAAERMTERMAGHNGFVERSAALADAGAPVAVLQFLRLIRDAGRADRRLFFNERELVAWLSQVLTPDEARRVPQFLAEAPPYHWLSRALVGRRRVCPRLLRHP